MLFVYLLLVIANLFWISLAVQSINGLRQLASLPEDVEPVSFPKISIIVPARNESRILPRTLETLRNLDYPEFEVLVLDDHSEDDTYEIAKEASERDSRIRAFKSAELPAGWRGKPWALQQGAGIAEGNWLLFTDADILYHPKTLRCAIGLAQNEKLDLLSVVPHMDCESFWEKVILPFFVVLLNIIRPLHKSNDPDSHVALASGGFLLTKTMLFRHIGGFEQIHHAIAEDLKLAELFKYNHYKIKTVITKSKWLRTRMYDSLHSIWEGLSRHAFEVSGYNPARLLLAVLTSYLFGIGPFAALIAGIAFHNVLLIALSLLPVITIIGMQTILNWRWGISLFYFFSFPLATFLYGLMMIDSMLSFYFRGGNLWKGRRYGRGAAGG